MGVNNSNTKFYLLLALVLGMGGNTIYSEVSETDDNQIQDNKFTALQSQITTIRDKEPQVIPGPQGMQGSTGERGEMGPQGIPGENSPFHGTHDDLETKQDHDKDDDKIRNILDEITTDYEILFDKIADTLGDYDRLFDRIDKEQNAQNERLDLIEDNIVEIMDSIEFINQRWEEASIEYDWN